MYISCLNRPGGLGGWDIWVSRRETVNDDWSEPENLGSPINTGQGDSDTNVSSDGLEMYFTAYKRPEGYGDSDIWVTRRATKNDPWAPPENLGSGINTSGYEHYPRISPDGLELYFSSSRSGGYGVEDIWVTKRATKNDPWAEPVNLGPTINSSASEDFPSLSSDGLLLVFSENRDSGPLRPGGYGGPDLWAARRASVSDPWGTPVNLGPMVNSSSLDCAATLSPDGHALYFTSERPGGLGGPYGDIYQAPIIPIVDFNGDGIVDTADMSIMIDHWGENYSLCDIGPMPWGDGIVDVQDLIILAEHMCGYNNPIAHWTLDEREGNTAYDKVGENNASIYGGALWQPADGMFGGALELDGIDDYAGTDFVLDPAGGMFSAFAWIIEGSPGQAIIFQADSTESGQTWLGTERGTGKLLTELVPPPVGRFIPQPLKSEFVITDGQWHHIGFVWDGSYRYLYVDGIEVAKDVIALTLAPLESVNGGLHIGAGKILDAGTFFSGMIDDVRIYNQALTAEEVETIAW